MMRPFPWMPMMKMIKMQVCDFEIHSFITCHILFRVDLTITLEIIFKYNFEFTTIKSLLDFLVIIVNDHHYCIQCLCFYPLVLAQNTSRQPW